MSWTSPKTWVVGTLTTAADLNTHIRDNLRYLKGLDGDITFGSNILTAFLIDGVDASDHNTRHENGGADALSTPIHINAVTNLTYGSYWKGNGSNRPTET